MHLILYNQVAAPDCLRVWIGATKRKSMPRIAWSLDGVPVSPFPLRPLQPVRSDELATDPTEPRTWTGMYEFAGLASATSYSIRAQDVEAPDMAQEIHSRTLPRAISEAGFHILLSSCYHERQANKGYLAQAVSLLTKACAHHGAKARPDMSILMGDQVYLDLPTFEALPGSVAGLAGNFEQKYLNNWANLANPGFEHVLRAAPYAAMADDHELWNNAPHPSPIIRHSWTAEGRGRYRTAALAMFAGFQAPMPLNGEEPPYPLILDIPPISLFIADTRIERTTRHFMTAKARKKLQQWIGRINSQGLHGVFVSGQSLFAEKVNAVRGSLADWELPNYDDFHEVAVTLKQAAKPLICVSGDVHWGRNLVARSRMPQHFGDIYEVITSPVALVHTVGVDTLKTAGAGLGRLFFQETQWPRHSTPSTRLGPFTAEGRTRSHAEGEVLDTLKGDQIALLSFFRNGPRLSARIRHWAVDGKSRQPRLDRELYSRSINLH
ncbi:MAG: hypothetical protein EA399_06980 [Desulfovibrionales bacterium]|nr:MAG: hypothetical protein EA399_06980 [Desulfovibrionales bacterium]